MRLLADTGSYVLAETLPLLGANNNQPLPSPPADGEAAALPGTIDFAEEQAKAHARRQANQAMERYANGDDGAFGELYDALAPRLHQFLLRQARDPSRAEDLLQQTLLHMHRARGRFVPGADVFPWAYAIARRLVIDGVRRAKFEAPAPDPAAGVVSGARGADELLDARRLTRAMEEELRKLPEAHRVAFELIKKDGLSVREAAEVLGTTATAVKLRAHRAYAALRRALGNLVDS